MRASRTRKARLVAGSAVAGLVLVSCGGQSLQQQGDAAKANLMKASSIEITVRLDDPDGDLRAAAMADGELTESQADALIGGSYSTTIARAGGKPLSEATFDPTAGFSAALADFGYSQVVRSGQGDLLELRVVDNTAYVALGAEEVDRLLAEADQDSLATLSEGVPAEFAPVVDALLAGEWLSVEFGQYLTQLEELLGPIDAAELAEANEKGAAAFTELLTSIEPHVSLRDLGSSGDEREVEVSVKVKSVLEAFLDQDAFFDSLGDVGAERDTLSDELDGAVTDSPVKGTLTLKGDHVDSLRLPLANVVPAVGPDTVTEAERQEFLDTVGSAALVVEIDDTAGEVTAPDDVSDVDVNALIESALGGLLGAFGGGDFGAVGPDGEFEYSPLPGEAEYEACLAEGTDPDVCDAEYYGEGIEVDPELEQQYADYDACVAAGTDPATCDAEVFGTDPGADAAFEELFAEYEACLAEGTEMAVCDEQLEAAIAAG